MLTYEKICELISRAEEDPKFLEKAESIRSIAGMGEPKQMINTELALREALSRCETPVLMFRPEELLGMGTTCGSSPNTCFTQEAVDFLKKNKVTKIFAAIACDGLLPSDPYMIQALEMNINGKAAVKFQNLIDDNHGSLRADYGTQRGWWAFESE